MGNPDTTLAHNPGDPRAHSPGRHPEAGLWMGRQDGLAAPAEPGSWWCQGMLTSQARRVQVRSQSPLPPKLALGPADLALPGPLL